MAVAGLHNNVSDFGPSFFGESPRQWDDDRDRPSTRASALLQMWRELEGENLVNQSYRPKQERNGSDSECQSTIGNGSDNGDDLSQVSDESENQGFSCSETEHEDSNSTISEQSVDLGGIERERVRQIFREWMNSGSKSHSSCGFRLNDRSRQWLGENECERVRIIRKWAQTTAQQRNNFGSSRDGVDEVGGEIEQVRDGLAAARPEIGARRPIRRLCGRQTLLDLLLRAQNERKRELLSLSERRPVSDFAHRNRIQALLRGRFLRNERLVLDERPSSVAASELGFLRLRHTVSDLREEFLSKLDNSASISVNNAGSDSSLVDGNNDESVCTCTEGEVTETHTASDLEIGADRNWNTQELQVQTIDSADPVLVNEGSEREVLPGAGSTTSREESSLATEARQHEVFTHVEHQSSRHGGEIIFNNTIESSASAETNYSGSREVYSENHDTRSCVSFVSEVNGHATGLEGNINEEFHSHDASAQVEEFQELVTEIEDGALQQLNTVAFTEWADGSRQDTDRSWREIGSSQSFVESFDNNAEEQEQMQESHEWPSHDLQEAIDSWLDMPSGDVRTSVGRLDAFDFSDDDNVRSIELRELFSRRRVSSLLRSDFRESLDQVLQSHVERLVQASDDWELEDDTSFPDLIEQDQEQINGDQTLAPLNGTERNLFAPSSNLFDATHPIWDEDLQDAYWPQQNSDQQEWEIINDLRMEMARLQQRMNNMQNMLEACMDMQVELQRSLRQEVSAALNRSIFSRDASAFEDNRLHDQSAHLDHIRKGICCLCQDSKIDSLLYRCGHMCSCTKCAENLVQSKGKCPMCRAPAVEAVRAYLIQ